MFRESSSHSYKPALRSFPEFWVFQSPFQLMEEFPVIPGLMLGGGPA
jgi:hypothetical protein